MAVGMIGIHFSTFRDTIVVMARATRLPSQGLVVVGHPVSLAPTTFVQPAPPVIVAPGRAVELEIPSMDHYKIEPNSMSIQPDHGRAGVPVRGRGGAVVVGDPGEVW